VRAGQQGLKALAVALKRNEKNFKNTNTNTQHIANCDSNAVREQIDFLVVGLKVNVSVLRRTVAAQLNCNRIEVES